MNLVEQVAAGQAPPIVPITVGQYHQMIATGIIREGDSIELIDGILIRKDRAKMGGEPMSVGKAHAITVIRLPELLRTAMGWGFHFRSQQPITLDDIGEPEPDLAIVRGQIVDYLDHHPGPRDIAAAMEVSDSSLNFDRTTKQRLYANAEIPIYWIVNLIDKQIEVYENPQPSLGKYAKRTDYRGKQTVTLALAVGKKIKVTAAELLLA